MKWIVLPLGLFTVIATAEKATVKVSDVPTDQDTSIVIKKGAPTADSCVEYQILTGNEEINGDAEYDRGKAYANWKIACAEWKKSMKELNKDNQFLTLSCGTTKGLKEDERHVFQSSGSYKLKTKIKDSK